MFKEAVMRKMTSFLAGAVTGALVGATLMVLFTPASGETIRSDVRKRVQGLRDQMSEAAAARRAELEAQLAGLRAPRA
jgi:gas vesicle protein